MIGMAGADWGAVGAILAAVVTGLFGLWQAHVTRRRIGKPNGHGNVAQMLDLVIRNQERDEERAYELTREVSNLGHRVARSEVRLDIIERGR